MKKKRRQFLAYLFPAFLIGFCPYMGCDVGINKVSSEKEDTILVPEAIIPALPTVAPYYADTLKCTNCNALFTQIAFQPDSSFTMIVQDLSASRVPEGRMGKWIQNGDTIRLQAGSERAWVFLIMPKSLQVLEYQNLNFPTRAMVVIKEVEKGSINPREVFNISGYYTKETKGVFTFCDLNRSYPVRPVLSATEVDKLFQSEKNKDHQPVVINADITVENVPDEEGNNQVQVMIHKMRKHLGYGKCP